MNPVETPRPGGSGEGSDCGGSQGYGYGREAREARDDGRPEFVRDERADGRVGRVMHVSRVRS